MDASVTCEHMSNLTLTQTHRGRKQGRTMVLREWLASRNGGIVTVITTFLVLTYVNVSIHQQYSEHVMNQVGFLSVP